MKKTNDRPDWRPIIAALANPNSRRIFAQIVLSEDPETLGRGLSPTRRNHALEVLVNSGLIHESEDGWVECDDIFGRVLAAAPRRERRTGVERFLTDAGKVDRYPSNKRERRELLDLIAGRALEEGEVVPEAILNDRLNAFTDDPATLRRYLVDEEILERSRTGSEYAHVHGSGGPAT